MPSPGGPLSLRGEAEHAAGVDEKLGRVELLVDAELRGGVVKGVLVVPVVLALSHGSEGDHWVLRRVDGGVIGVVAEEVSRGVHTPRGMENKHIAEGTGHPVAVPEVISPERADEAGEHEAHEEGEPRIVLLLEHNCGILQKIIKVQLLPGLEDGGVFLDV